MDYQTVTDFINHAKKFGSRLDLSRIKKLCFLLGNPEKKCKFIHVAGTNGKGSVSVYLENILMQAGYKTGLFTSPFIYDFNERIQINNTPISDEDLLSVMEQVVLATKQMLQEGDEHPTEFELITAAAFLYFAKERCDVVVLEVGLGGRLDATNVIEAPLLSVITSISIDHTEYLGDTLTEIAQNKCGIIKRGCPVLSYPNQANEVQTVIFKTAQSLGCTQYDCDGDAIEVIKSDLSGNEFLYRGEPFKTSLVGRYQVYNGATALCAARALAKEGLHILEEHIKAGLKCAKWPARFEILAKNPLLIADGSHNIDGMRAFVETAKTALCGRRVVCVFGMLRDKDYDCCLKSLSTISDTIICTEVDNPRKETAENLAKAAKSYFKTVYQIQDNKQAVLYAAEIAQNNDSIVCLGSLYMMKNIKDIAKVLESSKNM